ncbi:hypothetical protein HDE_13452 [Halotydeus destructor]|nr:hypothetical protein HDE_13452 [Halotydeus destructor]
MSIIIIISLLVFSQVSQLEAFHYEWLVPQDLHGCCSDIISKDQKCNVVEGAAFQNGTGVMFFNGGFYSLARFKSNHFPEVLLDQSVRPFADWDFARDDSNGWKAIIDDLLPLTDDSDEVEAAFQLDQDIVIKRGKTYFVFREAKGRAMETYLDCRQVNPAICEGNGERTEAVATYWGADGERYTQAFHYRPGVNRTYRVSTSKGRESWQTYELLPHDDTVDAILVYRHSFLSKDDEKKSKPMNDVEDSGNDVINYGVYFNLDGMACTFEVSSAELESRMGVTAIGTNLLKPSAAAGIPFLPRENCFPANVFLGCPQSWCYANDVDDIIVARTQVDFNSFRDEIVVYRGHYYWKADADRGIPMVPGDVRHQFLSLSGAGGNERVLSYIEAAEAFSIESRHFLLYFLDNELYLFRGTYGESEVHVDGEYKGGKKLRVGFDRLGFSQSDVFTDLNDFFPGKKCVTVDTMWYNKFETVMYVFCGPYYERYKVSYDGSIRIPKFTRLDGLTNIADTWPGLPRDLDGAFALGSNVHFVKGQWFWTLRGLKRDQNGAGTKMNPDVAFGSRKYDGSESFGLYATQQRCGYNDEAISEIRDAIKKKNKGPIKSGLVARQVETMQRIKTNASIRRLFATGLLGFLAVAFLAYVFVGFARNPSIH